MSLQRRAWLKSGVGWSALALAGCPQHDTPDRLPTTGDWLGASDGRGHLLRDRLPPKVPSVTRRVRVAIAGAGIAGLAAARALRLRRVEDFCVLELEDSAGGNSRGATLGGMACPLGAHYLPLPSDAAHDVQDFLEETGLRQRVSGRWRYDELHLCHSPQERLYFQGQWQDGLLPMLGVGADTLAQYQRFASLVEQARKAARYAIPSSKVPLAPVQRTLDAMTFVAWLDQERLTDAHLRWYLDYCCRDDYGAGITAVSAWAGVHYFASRHGFHVPGTDAAAAEPLLTWPQGNAWLVQRLAAGLDERLQSGRIVTRIATVRNGVEIDSFNVATQATERVHAQHCVVALPVHVALRVLESPPAALVAAAANMRHAAWLVANLLLDTPLHDRPGAAPSWDNVIYGSPGLGYVDAMHQSLRPVPGPTVLTSYRALGIEPAARQALQMQPWSHWRDQVLAELALPHPDLRDKVRGMTLARYGHAMATPVPGLKTALAARPPSSDRLVSFAHADWACYSIFEEAFTLGHQAGMQLR